MGTAPVSGCSRQPRELGLSTARLSVSIVSVCQRAAAGLVRVPPRSRCVSKRSPTCPAFNGSTGRPTATGGSRAARPSRVGALCMPGVVTGDLLLHVSTYHIDYGGLVDRVDFLACGCEAASFSIASELVVAFRSRPRRAVPSRSRPKRAPAPTPPAAAPTPPAASPPRPTRRAAPVGGSNE